MRIYTMGYHGRAPDAVAREVGLGRYVKVLVAATSKAEAYTTVMDLHLATAQRDPGLRVASGVLVDALTEADAGTGLIFTPGTAVVANQLNAATPLVRMTAPGTHTLLGYTRRDGKGRGAALRFHLAGPAPAVAPEPVPPTDPQDALDVLRAEIIANRANVTAATTRLEELRQERHRLAARAVEIGMVDAAASILGVTPGRVYQMSDAHKIDTVRRAKKEPAAGRL